MKLVDELKTFCGEHDLALTEAALLWIFGQKLNTFAIVGARNATQAIANASAGGKNIDDAVFHALDAIVSKHVRIEEKK